MRKAKTPEMCGGSLSTRFYEHYRPRHTLLRHIGKIARRGFERDHLDQRMSDELRESIVEALHGLVNTHYSFDVVGAKVRAEDGELLESLLSRGYDVAVRMAEADEYFADFLPARTDNEFRELQSVQAMIRGELGANTLLYFSPYSEEYDDGSGRLAHAFQRPDCKRAMLRMWHWDGRRAHIFTRSLDHSSLQLIKDVARSSVGKIYAAGANSTAVQGTPALQATMEYDEALDRLDSIVENYDELLSRGQTIQGRSASSAVDLELFVMTHPELVSSLLAEVKEAADRADNSQLFKTGFEALLVSYIALARNMIEHGDNIAGSLEDAAVRAGESAAGESFNVCGVVIGGNKVSAATQFESLQLLANKFVTCPECRTQVVVDTKYLAKGQLHCRACDHTVDVCRGVVRQGHRSTSRRRVVASRAKKPAPFSFLWPDVN